LSVFGGAFVKSRQDKNSLQEVKGLMDSGRMAEARDLCIRAVRRNKNDVNARFLLASICGGMGDYREMEKQLTGLLKLNPDLAVAHHNLGIAVAMQGRHREAIPAFSKALTIQPEFIESAISLADVELRLNEPGKAIEQLKYVLRVDPSRADVYCKFGLLHRRLGDKDEAVRLLTRACAIKHDYAEPYKHLHGIYYDDGKFEDAKRCCEEVLSIARDDGTRIRHATMVPIIMGSGNEISEFRKSLLQRIDLMSQESLEVNDPVREIGYTSFQLAYHGLDDRLLQTRLADLYVHACPGLVYESGNCLSAPGSLPDRPVKIGFISKHLREHSIGKAARGLMSKLPRDKFHVTAFVFEEAVDEIGKSIRECADKTVMLEYSLKNARKRIEDERVDILFYQDIGMEPFTYFLAFSRLAPVQCTYFGHPVTTGIPAMDYFISTNIHEPHDSERHYSERLILLEDVAAPSYCEKPAVPELDLSRDRFGIHENEHIYFCPQTLFKFHPEFDHVLGNILRQDESGRIVLKVGNRPYLAELLKTRFGKTIPDVASRITFLPQLSNEDYFSLIALSNVMLDTIHFGGFTTTIDAIAVGTPVVTWPGEFMRGRHSMSFYRKMGIPECIADDLDDYVHKAVALASDPGYRESVSKKILDASAEIWEEERLIKEFERVFIDMLKGDAG
jgi:predicted O-linked N-acetylglucosamine transferase (SPINDLY family)